MRLIKTLQWHRKKHKSSSQKSSKKGILGDEPVAKAKPAEAETNRDSPAASGSRHESPAATSSSKAASAKTPAEIRFEETQRKRVSWMIGFLDIVSFLRSG